MADNLAELGTEFAGFTQEMRARMLGLEQKATAPMGQGAEYNATPGQKIAEHEGFKAVQRGARRSGRIEIGSFHHKAAILNAPGLNQPLVPPYYRPGIIAPGQRRLTIRDLLPSIPITSNMVEFAKESSSTDAAAMQTAEGTAKAESALGFELKYSPVQTLAHWIPVSRQIMDDAPALQAYVNSRLMYFLKLKEEDQLLNGDGTGQNLSGLITNATPFDVSQTVVATDTFIDVLGHAISQVQLSYFEPDAIIMHPKDLWRVMLTKTTGTASSGQYIFADPHTVETPRIWGLQVVATQSMAESQFLVGAFGMAAAIWDRNDASVEVSREHADFFTRNLCAILTEERLALTVFRSDALVVGGFPFGS